MPYDIRNIDNAHRREALRLITSAFEGDALYKYYTQDKGKKHRRMVRKLVSIELDGHLWDNHIVHGVFSNDELLGVSMVKVPQTHFNVMSHLRLLYQLILKTNPFVAFRVLFSAVRSKIRVSPLTHHYFSALAVREDVRRNGIGTMLLDDLKREVESHPYSSGIAMRTTSPGVVKMFEREGFSVVGNHRIFGFGKFHMFCPRPA